MNTKTMYDQLAEHAPAPTTHLDHLMPSLATPAPRSARRRRLVFVGAIATVTLGLVGASLVLPQGVPDAAAVEELAAVAGRQPAQAPSVVLHQIVTERQQGLGDKRVLESWTLADGTTWRRDIEYDGSLSYYLFPPLKGLRPSHLPADVAALPTNPTLLDAWVRLQVSGSSSTDEAVFVYYGDVLRLGFVPPTVRKAMVTAMGRLPHTTVETSATIDGRTCLKVTYREPVRVNEGDFYCFDTSTSAILEEGVTLSGSIYFRSTLNISEYVAAVPDAVVAEAAKRAEKDKAEASAPVATPTPERTPR